MSGHDLVYSDAGESGAWLWIWFASIAASAGPREICKGWLEDDRGPRNHQDTWQQMPKACTCLQWRSDWTITTLQILNLRIRRMAALMLDQKGSLEEQRMLTEAAFKKCPKIPRQGRQFHHHPRWCADGFFVPCKSRYATGRLGHQIFLRRSDLNQLFVDSPLAEGTVSSHRSFSQLEECFLREAKKTHF